MSEKTIIAWTERTWNPWRGCTRISPGCDNCLSPDTAVLYADMTYRPIGDVQVGDFLASFDEWPDQSYRRTRIATVEGIKWSSQPTNRVITDSGELRATQDHRWLRRTPSAWVPTRQLASGRSLRRIVTPSQWSIDDDYRAGYIAGITKGDGTFRYDLEWGSVWRKESPQCYWRVALIDDEPLGRLVAYLASFGIESHIKTFDSGCVSNKPMQKIETRVQDNLAVLHYLVNTEHDSTNWARGWLAGFFDAEGDHGKSLRVSQNDRSVLRTFCRLASRIGLTFKIEQCSNCNGRAGTARLYGDMTDRFAFFVECRPAIRRKMASLWGRTLETRPERIMAIEPAVTEDVVDIQTSTGTFVANGLATHNCYMFTAQSRYGRDPSIVVRTKTWGDPLRWQREAERSGRTELVFTCSWSDWFHKDADRWRDDAWALVRSCPNLSFQILTKRAGRIASHLPPDWGSGYPNVWLGVSIENMDYAWRADYLRKIPATVRFISYEPALGPLDDLDLTGIDWVIVGGESGPGYRDMHLDWARMMQLKCEESGAAFFFKQSAAPRTETGIELDGRIERKWPTPRIAQSPLSLFPIVR